MLLMEDVFSIFCRPKNYKMIPTILSLKIINKVDIQATHFKMETLESATEPTCKNCFFWLNDLFYSILLKTSGRELFGLD